LLAAVARVIARVAVPNIGYRGGIMISAVRLFVGAVALASLIPLPAPAENFPAKPITIMVGLAPGGITDVTARLYAEVVSRNLGQRITIENRPAAAGALAAAAVQNAPPDGYMLLVFSGSQHATVAAMGSAPYDPVKGFAFITVLFNSVVAFTVPPDSPAKTLDELFDLGRKRPGGLSMGTPGLGSPSHLLGARVALAAKAPLQSIHYRGGAPMMADVLTGRVDFAVATLSTSRAFLADKKLRALALDADARWSGLPDVPVLAELGYGKEKVANWFGVAAPAGTPAAIVEKLRAEFVNASQDPELQKRLAENGTLIATSTSDEMRSLMVEEVAAMEMLVKTLGLRPQ
jgi:tripartite-type tricarboxylate transporter receptor subunit TctC